MKKGVFFSLDALIALIIIIIIVLIAFPLQKKPIFSTSIHHDTLVTLTNLKIGEIDDPVVKNLISQGLINDLDKSVLDQIGEFYITDEQLAKNIASSILQNLNTNQNIGIWFGNTLIASKNSTSIINATDIDTAKQIVSGISSSGNGSLTGFSSQASLSSSKRVSFTNFGGYVGDGNVTAKVEYSGTITAAELEAVISEPYELLVNGNFIGSFPPYINEVTPTKYIFTAGDLTHFNSGENLITIRSSPGSEILHISGGNIKISYSTDVQYEQVKKYNFPEIDGFINLYDSFFVRDIPSSMSISIHYQSENIPIFLTIGNTTIFTAQSVGEETLTFNNVTLSSLLNFTNFNKKTIPLRIGLENSSFVINKSTGADVFSVTDISGSMGGSKITAAKDANHILKEIILGINRSRIGLVGYESSAKESDYHFLSKNNNTLNNVINNVWDASGGTCICCGINRAISGFQEQNAVGTLSVRVSASFDDAEERSTGTMESLYSPDLELVTESTVQQVGMRFRNLNIEQGTTINSAYIEFETDETNSETTNLVFNAQDIDDAPQFSSSKFDISSRTKTSASVSWNNIPAWNTVSEKHQTPDLTPIIQEVIDRTGWNINNDLVIIVTGSGERTAESYNGESANAPLLVIEFEPPFICGDGITEGDEDCDDGNTENGDSCSEFCVTEDKLLSMVVMSDGQANGECSEQNTGDAREDAIQAACDAYENNGITVHAVGFGSTADEATLQSIANCGNGTYEFSDVANLVQTYEDLAEEIIAATFYEQTLVPSGNLYSKLFSDSYIEFDYITDPTYSGLVLTNEKPFSSTVSGNFELPSDSEIIETQIISYSGPRWTKRVSSNSNITFDLAKYGSDFLLLGDPYSISIPNNKIKTGTNTITLATGLNPVDEQPGSLSNKIIYTIVKNISSFSTIAGKSSGCNWHIQFEDDTEIETLIPSGYAGSDNCYYNETLPIIATQRYNSNDALQSSVYNLLQELDLEDPKNLKINIPFTNQDLEITSTEITGIPFTWSTEVQVRIWS